MSNPHLFKYEGDHAQFHNKSIKFVNIPHPKGVVSGEGILRFTKGPLTGQSQAMIEASNFPPGLMDKTAPDSLFPPIYLSEEDFKLIEPCSDPRYEFQIERK